MTKVITVRLREDEVAKCDAEARRLGLTRTEYVRYRLFPDEAEEGASEGRFLSQDLVGSFTVGTGSTNPEVRKALAKRAR